MTTILFDAFWDDAYLPFLPEDLIRAELEEDMVFYGIQKEEGKTPVGAAAVEFTGNHTARLRHLYIKKEERQKGYGKELFHKILTDLLTRGTERLILTYFPGESEALDRLLSPLETDEIESDKTLFSFPIYQVEKVFLPIGREECVKPLSEATPEELKALFSMLSTSERIPVQLSQIVRDCREDYSFFYAEKGIPQAVLFTELREREILIPFAYSNAQSINALQGLLTTAGEVLKKDFQPEDTVSFVTSTPGMSTFLEKVLHITGRQALDVRIDLAVIREFADEEEQEDMDI